MKIDAIIKACYIIYIIHLFILVSNLETLHVTYTLIVFYIRGRIHLLLHLHNNHILAKWALPEWSIISVVCITSNRYTAHLWAFYKKSNSTKLFYHSSSSIIIPRQRSLFTEWSSNKFYQTALLSMNKV